MGRAVSEPITKKSGPVRHPTRHVFETLEMAWYIDDRREWEDHRTAVGDLKDSTGSRSGVSFCYDRENPQSQFNPTVAAPERYERNALPPVNAPLGTTAEDPAGFEFPQSMYNYGTWTVADDRTLISARSSGQNWADLQRTYFPSKTANACRKRYERLKERRGIEDTDTSKQQRISGEYVAMRKQMWSPLAKRVGEDWEVVEEMCMSLGIRNIQTHARAHTNRWRRESRASQRAREIQMPPVSTGLPACPTDVGYDVKFDGREQGTSGDLPPMFPVHHHTDAELMPPPPFGPGSGASVEAPENLPIPAVTFAGYLNGRSTRWAVGSLKKDARSRGAASSIEGSSWHGESRCEPG
ncbi:hypothetical protein QBC35DRAFT_40112 [Podospora australis]|uniref:Myb-like domain-containing protein n=1 Tax=Podospora australis TaxID=1536484 RepID=A0AAN6WMB6_9PEZI|nr:hypothetical protein QBC35DRAFT_40112 [Podospora australis]